MKYLLAVLGTLWSVVFGVRALVFLLIPWWGGVWFPYFPRKARRGRRPLVWHFVAGRLIPKGLGKGFVTGAQTHWNFVWFADDTQWNRDRLVIHEERHVAQEWLFGPLFGLLYVGHFLWNFLRWGDTQKAYEEIVFERDARDAEKQK